MQYLWNLIKRLFSKPRQFCLMRVRIQADQDSLPLVTSHFRKEGVKCGRSNGTDCLWIDFGGAIFKNELQVEFEANGVKFGAYARHLPTLLWELQSLKELKNLPQHFLLSGFMFNTIISSATRDAAEKEVESLVKKHIREIGEVERAMNEVFRSNKESMVRKANCILCGSERSYVECCGSPTAN